MNSEVYNKGRESCLSGKYDIQKTYYDYRGGFETAIGKAYIDTYPKYEKVNGYATTPEWHDFTLGWNSVHEDKQNEKRKEYKVDVFLSELKTLCQKYGVTIYSDDDYHCGRIKDYEFDIDT